MADRLKIIRVKYLASYLKSQPLSVEKHLAKLSRRPLTPQNFHFYLVNSSCNSSMIEGSSLSEDDYIKLKDAGYISKDISEIDNMIEAYRFASEHVITERNLLHAHKIVSKNFPIPKQFKGSYRDRMLRVWNGQKVVYTAAKTEIVNREMGKLLHDIALLTERKTTIAETFYFASMIHLVLVSIHPFADGNGRMARLLEKWFLASKIGDIAWRIQSEKLYFRRRRSYYNNLAFRDDYSTIDYGRSEPFLLMLPMALRLK